MQAELEGPALARARRFGKIAQAGSRCLRSALVAMPVLFAGVSVTVAENRRSATPSIYLKIAVLVCAVHTLDAARL